LLDPNTRASSSARDREKDSSKPAQAGARARIAGLSAAAQAAWDVELQRADERGNSPKQIGQIDQIAGMASERSRSKLQEALAAADRFAQPAEVIASVVLPVDPAARRQERELVDSGRVDRSELRAINSTTDPRVAKVIARARADVALEADQEARDGVIDEQGAAAAARSALRIAPHRRHERPVSKLDTPRAKLHIEARVMAKAIVNSRGKHVIQSYLIKLRSILSGQPLFALRNAALVPLEGGYRYTYADECARRRIAIGLLFLVCGRWTSQRTAYGSASTRRGLLVAGWSVHRILTFVRPVGRRAYDRHVFSRGSKTDHPTWLGDMALFARYGFCSSKRLPAERLQAWEIGEGGKPKNRYWIGCVVSSKDPKREARNRPMSRLGAVFSLGEQLDVSAHAAGWAWADEDPQYAPRLSAAPPVPPF
jgi:hypothetical protein